jgi:DNA-binding Lrp family transcriptional regulator
MPLDELDTKLLQFLSVGTNSYAELARLCNVTRNTVYRRIAALENRGIIKNTIRCIINLDQIDITPVCFGVTIAQADQDEAFNLLAAHRNVKLLWRTYGEHNMTLVALCPKGREGKVISSVKAILEEFDVSHLCVSVGFMWEKTDFTPFDGPAGIEEKITQIIENTY